MRSLLIVVALVLVTMSIAAADPGADRVDAAAKVYAALQSRPESTPPEQLYTWSVRWLDAELDAQPKSAAKALAAHHKRMVALEASVTAKYKSALVDTTAVAMAAYYRAEADFWVARGRK